MEKIYLFWWALVVGLGLAGLLRASFEVAKQRTVTKKVISSLVVVVLVVAAMFACPSMVTLDYNGITCSESRYGVSWMLLTAAASTLVLSFRSGSSKRARRYLSSHNVNNED